MLVNTRALILWSALVWNEALLHHKQATEPNKDPYKWDPSKENRLADDIWKEETKGKNLLEKIHHLRDLLKNRSYPEDEQDHADEAEEQLGKAERDANKAMEDIKEANEHADEHRSDERIEEDIEAADRDVDRAEEHVEKAEQSIEQIAEDAYDADEYAEDVAKAQNCNFDFCIDDKVTWLHSDSDIPEGEVGTVVGFTKDKVKVKFKSGIWILRPEELRLAKAATTASPTTTLLAGDAAPSSTASSDGDWKLIYSGYECKVNAGIRSEGGMSLEDCGDHCEVDKCAGIEYYISSGRCELCKDIEQGSPHDDAGVYVRASELESSKEYLRDRAQHRQWQRIGLVALVVGLCCGIPLLVLLGCRRSEASSTEGPPQ